MNKLILGDCLEEMKKLEGRGYIGIELEPEYYEIAKRRVEATQPAPMV